MIPEYILFSYNISESAGVSENPHDAPLPQGLVQFLVPDQEYRRTILERELEPFVDVLHQNAQLVPVQTRDGLPDVRSLEFSQLKIETAILTLIAWIGNIGNITLIVRTSKWYIEL